MELFVFVCAAIMVLVGALGVVLRSNPVHAALSMILTLFGIAVLFVAREANFLAAVQVIVYAGAIVVLFLFVIMLLGVDRAEDLRTEPLGSIQRPLALVLGVGMFAVLTTAIVRSRESLRFKGEGVRTATLEDADGNIRQIARSIFGDYVVAFELTSVLLIVAVVGTVVLARRRKSERTPS
ncbi:MAG: NADH-quinone oxidoreductase subunit J [Actinomycetota bacterium]|jgi:NADH-quinone oxidoreductase subunit J